MARKGKRKLTAAEKAAKKKRQQEFMTIFIRGKQKRVKRPPTIDGMDVDEFIRQNADPIWLHQMGMWGNITDDSAGTPYVPKVDDEIVYLDEELYNYDPAEGEMQNAHEINWADADDDDLPF